MEKIKHKPLIIRAATLLIIFWCCENAQAQKNIPDDSLIYGTYYTDAYKWLDSSISFINKLDNAKFEKLSDGESKIKTETVYRRLHDIRDTLINGKLFTWVGKKRYLVDTSNYNSTRHLALHILNKILLSLNTSPAKGDALKEDAGYYHQEFYKLEIVLLGLYPPIDAWTERTTRHRTDKLLGVAIALTAIAAIVALFFPKQNG